MAYPQKAVLITGASSGIGKACAQRLAQQGFRVYAGVRRLEDGEALQQECDHIIPVLLDVTDLSTLQSTEKLLQEANLSWLGLVNNAGIAVGGPLEFIPLEDVRQQLEVNVMGTLATIQTFLPLLRQTQGRIVNISSVAGLMALPFVAPYSISKYGVEALSDALRVELRPWNIAVSLIEPGSIQTPFWEKSIAMADALGQVVPAEAFALYETATQKVRQAAVESSRHGIPPDAVAQAVVDALTAKHPKTRYLVGKDAWLRKLLMPLPDTWKDRLIIQKLGL